MCFICIVYVKYVYTVGNKNNIQYGQRLFWVIRSGCLFYFFLLNNIRKGITLIIRKPFFFSLKKKEEN